MIVSRSSGRVDAAVYIDKKLREEGLLTRAFNLNKERGTADFDLVCVGHSLGAGAAAILAIMLRQEFPRTRGFVYSPPGGTLRYRGLGIKRTFLPPLL